MTIEPIHADAMRKTICFLRAALLECRTLDAERFHTYLLTLDADPKAIVDECCNRGWLRGPWRRFDREALRSDPARYELLDKITTTELPAPPAADAKSPKRTGSRKPCADDQIIAALCLIHCYENGSIGNDEPATLAEIAINADVKSPCISKFFKKYHKHFGSKHAYEVACRNRTLGTKLTLLNRDLPEVYKPGDFE